MANVHGLYSDKKDKDDDEDKDDSNSRFVGGIGDHGGGSGLAVQPNMDEEGPDRDRVFGLAENATSEDSQQARRTITMYRDGFVVDDGPYRRLNDPANAEFLRSLAEGRTPRELLQDSDQGNVTVGLIDKRSEEFVQEFQSFSGQGTSLGTTTTTTSNVFDPATLPSPPPLDSSQQPTTSIQVRLLNGQRRVLRVPLTATVADLAAHLREDAGSESFRLVAGFPPKPLEDRNLTVQEAGLKGSQIQMQKAG